MKKNQDWKKDGVLSEIHDHIKGKRVLDIGCVEHDISRKNKQRIWVHGFLCEHAKKVKGIDIVQKDIKKMQSDGYDVSCQSAEDFTFKEKFDVIFAGELIEHLSNPGLFFERCRKHLKKNGLLILTTPNAFSSYRFICILSSLTNDPSVNPEHTCWYSPSTLKELLSRYDFKTDNIVFRDFPIINPRFKHKVTKFVSMLFSVFGGKFKESMIFFVRLR